MWLGVDLTVTRPCCELRHHDLCCSAPSGLERFFPQMHDPMEICAPRQSEHEEFLEVCWYLINLSAHQTALVFAQAEVA